MNYELLAFILYFIAMLAIGVYFFIKNKNNSEKEYFFGGRQMGPWVTAMSAQASDMSAWLLMGLPGSIFAFGLGEVWIGIGLMLGTIANWIFVAKRLRRFSEAADDSFTLPQYLSNRFVLKTPVLKIICAIVFFETFTLYVASAFSAGALVLVRLFPGLDSTVAMTGFAAIILIYTFLGGYRAVCHTDFLQAILMIVALLSVPIAIICSGSLDTSLITNDFTFVNSLFSASWRDIVSGLAWGLGYFGMPHILVRFMSVEKQSMVKKSITGATIWIVLAIGSTIALAYLGRMFVLPDGTPFAHYLPDREMIFAELSRILFPPFLSGVLLTAIIAASMSTADSQLLVASSSFTSDIYKPVFRKNASDKEMLKVARITVVLISVAAFFIANSSGRTATAVMDMVSNAWALFGSAFGPVVLFSLFWRRVTYKGVIAGVVAGTVVDILWLIFLSASTGIYELLPGFIACAFCCYVVSLIDKAPSKEVTDVFDTAMQMSDEE